MITRDKALEIMRREIKQDDAPLLSVELHTMPHNWHPFFGRQVWEIHFKRPLIPGGVADFGGVIYIDALTGEAEGE